MRQIASLLFIGQIILGCGRHSDSKPEISPNPGILSHGNGIEGSIATEGGGGTNAVNGLFWGKIEELSSCLFRISSQSRGDKNDLPRVASLATSLVRTFEEMQIPMMYHFNSNPTLAIWRHPEGRLDSDDFSRRAKLQVSYTLFPSSPDATERLYVEFVHFALKGKTEQLCLEPARLNHMIDLLAHLCSHEGTI